MLWKSRCLVLKFDPLRVFHSPLRLHVSPCTLLQFFKSEHLKGEQLGKYISWIKVSSWGCRGCFFCKRNANALPTLLGLPRASSNPFREKGQTNAIRVPSISGFCPKTLSGRGLCTYCKWHLQKRKPHWSKRGRYRKWHPFDPHKKFYITFLLVINTNELCKALKSCGATVFPT